MKKKIVVAMALLAVVTLSVGVVVRMWLSEGVPKWKQDTAVMAGFNYCRAVWRMAEGKDPSDVRIAADMFCEMDPQNCAFLSGLVALYDGNSDRARADFAKSLSQNLLFPYRCYRNRKAELAAPDE